MIMIKCPRQTVTRQKCSSDYYIHCTESIPTTDDSGGMLWAAMNKGGYNSTSRPRASIILGHVPSFFAPCTVCGPPQQGIACLKGVIMRHIPASPSQTCTKAIFLAPSPKHYCVKKKMKEKERQQFWSPTTPHSLSRP